MADEFINILKQFELHAKTTNSKYSIRDKDAQNWFINATNKLELNMSQIGNQKGTTNYRRIIKKPRHGQMYLFRYEPIGRQKLKYYDRFPLTIVVDVYRDGFLALNLHYLPIKLRIALLNKLAYFLNSHNYELTAKFKQLTYKNLIPFVRFREALPALHRYNVNNFRSRVVKIFPDEWLLASFLPAQRWMKQSENTVYAHSKRLIMKARLGNYGTRTE